MYCIHCGVKLGDAEKKCPLCGVVVFHPEIIREEGEPLYPGQQYPAPQVNSRAAQIVVTTSYLHRASMYCGHNPEHCLYPWSMQQQELKHQH